MKARLYDHCKNRYPECFCQRDNTKTVAISRETLSELERLAHIGRLTEKLLETGSMQHRFRYLDDIRSVEQLIEWGDNNE